MKNTLNGDNGRLDIAEEKISEHEIETLENVEWKENYKKKIHRASRNCGTSGGLIYV